jgi:hypothetical protein
MADASSAFAKREGTINTDARRYARIIAGPILSKMTAGSTNSPELTIAPVARAKISREPSVLDRVRSLPRFIFIFFRAMIFLLPSIIPVVTSYYNEN